MRVECRIILAMPDLDVKGRSLLHAAALQNDPHAASRRLEAGDDPDLEDVYGFTPLHLAATAWSIDVARLLLDHGARVDPVNQFGNTHSSSRS